MLVMYIAWTLFKRPSPLSTAPDDTPASQNQRSNVLHRVWATLTYTDIVNIHTVDLRRDEHDEEPEDTADDAAREAKLKGRWGWVWKVYYAVV